MLLTHAKLSLCLRSQDTAWVIAEEGVNQVHRPLLEFLTGVQLTVLCCLFCFRC